MKDAACKKTERLSILIINTLLFLCALLLSSVGCAREQSVIGKEASLPVLDKNQAVNVALEVLAEMYFIIDKADVESGLVRTKPLPGAQFFEFWRSDNIGANSWLQSNLHSIRRTAEVYVDDQDESISINCSVVTERLSLPEREIDSSARAYQMFSSSSISLQTLRLYPENVRNMAWIDLGHDVELEAEILRRIEKRLNW